MRKDHAAITQADGKVRILVDCTQCGTPRALTATMANYLHWLNGELVQNAFPEIPHEDRELLVSGTCGACFKKMFGVQPSRGRFRSWLAGVVHSLRRLSRKFE